MWVVALGGCVSWREWVRAWWEGQCQFCDEHFSELEGFGEAVNLAHKALPTAVDSDQV